MVAAGGRGRCAVTEPVIHSGHQEAVLSAVLGMTETARCPAIASAVPGSSILHALCFSSRCPKGAWESMLPVSWVDPEGCGRETSRMAPKEVAQLPPFSCAHAAPVLYYPQVLMRPRLSFTMGSNTFCDVFLPVGPGVLFFFLLFRLFLFTILTEPIVRRMSRE